MIDLIEQGDCIDERPIIGITASMSVTQRIHRPIRPEVEKEHTLEGPRAGESSHAVRKS